MVFLSRCTTLPLFTLSSFSEVTVKKKRKICWWKIHCNYISFVVIIFVWNWKFNRMESSVFSDITPCSPVSFTCCLLHAGSLLSLLFDLETKVIHSSEILFDFHHTTWNYIPADSTLHDHHWENLKACIMGIAWVMIF